MSHKVPYSDLQTLTKAVILDKLEHHFQDSSFLLKHNENLFKLLLKTMRTALVIEKKHIMLKNLGTLKVTYKEHRSGVRNPNTKKEAEVPARYTVTLGKASEGEKLNTSDLIHLLSNRYACSTKHRIEIKKYVLKFIALISAVSKGKTRIEIRGFGVFYPSVHEARDNARNPKTGEIISIPERVFVLFKASTLLSDDLNAI